MRIIPNGALYSRRSRRSERPMGETSDLLRPTGVSTGQIQPNISTNSSSTTPEAGETATEAQNDHKDPFRDRHLIPRVFPEIYVYPHSASEIPSAYNDRFYEIVNIFRQNMLVDGKLRDLITCVDYSLRLCGPSKEMAHPSILVFCRRRDSKQLNCLFNRDDLKEQYLVRKTTPLDLWRSWLKQEAKVEPQRPLFNLYLLRYSKPHVLLGFGGADIDIATSSSSPPNLEDDSLTLCGFPVRSISGGHRTATLGCVLQIDSRFYGLTASHALRPLIHRLGASPSTTHAEPKTEQCISPEGDTSGVPAIEQGASSPLREGDYDFLEYHEDVIYEDFTDEESDFYDEDSEVRSEDGEGAFSQDNTSAVVAFMDNAYDYQGPDLDWALIRLDQPERYRPNAFFSPSDPSAAVFIQPKAARLPHQPVDVFVLVSPRRVKRGVLQPSTAFLGSIEGIRPSTVWTVIMNDKEELTRGDSGSLVIDAERLDIYGHVIGLNPLGEIYVSPLMDTLEQVQCLFPRSEITIPNPRHLLANSISLYLENDQYNEAIRQLNYLHIYLSESPYRTWNMTTEMHEVVETAGRQVETEIIYDPTAVILRYRVTHLDVLVIVLCKV